MQRLSDSKISRWCGIFVALVALRASGSKNDDLGRRVRRRRALALALGAGAMGKVRAVRARTRKEEVMRCRCAPRGTCERTRKGRREEAESMRAVGRTTSARAGDGRAGSASVHSAPRMTPPAHKHPIVHLRASFIRLVESPPLTRPSHTRNRRRHRPPVAEQAGRTEMPKARGRRTNGARRARRHSRMDLDPNQHRPTGTARLL
ncbi:hypothetical protein B0H14DRAFT_1369243 [Mycena olivaceomarginata]|nr:hypothetical protein B0H14DRAFT_1369243 [Mycena olivaceomarginata]